MNPGRLKFRIRLESPGTTQNAIGETVAGWTHFATVYADIVDISGREYVAAGASQNTANTKITIRHLDGVTNAMRALHGSNTYNVESVLGQDKKSLLLMCTRAA